MHSAHQHCSIFFRTFPTRPNADSMHATTNIDQGQPVTNAGSRCLDQIGCNILTTKSTEPTQSKTELSCMSSKPPSKRRPRISLFGLRCGASRISIVNRYVNGPSLTCHLKQLPLDVEQLQTLKGYNLNMLEIWMLHSLHLRACSNLVPGQRLFLDVEPKANNAWSNFLQRTSTLEQSSGRDLVWAWVW